MKRIVPITLALPLTVVVALLLRAESPLPLADSTGVVNETLMADLHHSLYGTVTPDPTDAPHGTPGELLVCLSCHAAQADADKNALVIERDCQACHGINAAIADRHHVLYGSPIPNSTDAPYRASAEFYICLSCHETDTSSGDDRFLVERDCWVCHGGLKQPPVADPNGPYTGSVGQPVQFDGTASYDPDGTIVAYRWGFGDGGFGTGPVSTHTYSSAGTYTVSLTISDDSGETGAATTTVEITDSGPGHGSWTVKVPLLQTEFELRLEEFAGVLIVDEIHPDGTIFLGIGLEFDGFIAWHDVAGSLFFGMIDHNAGTMRGITINFRGGNAVWFAEQRR